MFLYQPSKGYCFNSDSVFLYQFISAFVPLKNRKQKQFLDVGCGVGIVGMLLQKEFGIKLTSIDKQESMIFYAEKNAAANKLDTTILRGDFLTHAFEKRFDFIVSNPPFYHSDVIQSDDEHLNTSRYNHHLPLKEFIAKAAKLLKHQGRFIFCYDAKQVDELIFHLKQNGLNIEALQFVHPKADKEAKLVFICARDCSKSMTKIFAPYIVFDQNGEYTPKAAEAFAKAATHSVKCER